MADSFNQEPWENDFIEEIKSSTNQLLSLRADPSDASKDDEKPKLKCNVCDKSLVTEMHYHCLYCAEYNLCVDCFKSRKFNAEHKTGHPVLKFPRPNVLFGREIKEGIIVNFDTMKEIFHQFQHEGVSCDGTDCGMSPLTGVRLTCDTCSNFDLCLKCFEKENYNGEHSNDHPVLVNGKSEPEEEVVETKTAKANKQVDIDLLKKLLERLGIPINVENAVKSNFETLDVDSTNMAMFLEFFQDGNLSIDSPKHDGVTCKVCSAQNFIIDRYKCTICKDYDLCGNCFEQGKFNGEHLKGHPMVRFSGPNEVFGVKINANDLNYDRLKKKYDNDSHNYVCNGCKVNPIKGLRFRCDECNDFDLCSICYESKKDIEKHNTDHALVISKRNMEINVDTEITRVEKIEDITYGNMNTATYNNNKVSCKMLEYTPIALVRGVSEENFQKYVYQEVMTDFNSSYVKKYFGVGYKVVQIDNQYHMLSEYMEKGTLESLLNNGTYISLRDKLQIACNVATAMRRFHEKNIVFESIRPDNIFINQDFIAKVGGKGAGNLKYFNYNKGPLEFEKYMPKEFFNPGKWDSKLDIFTFGLTLYHLFSGQKHSLENTKNKEVIIKINTPSPYFTELIDKCLSEKPADRPTAEYVEKTLKTYLRILMGVINFTDYFFISDYRKDQHFTQVYKLITEKLKALNTST